MKCRLVGCGFLLAVRFVSAASMVTERPLEETLRSFENGKMASHMRCHFGCLEGNVVDKTEYAINCALKKEPIARPIKYLCLPWATLVFAKVFKYGAEHKKMLGALSSYNSHEANGKIVFTVCGTSAARRNVLGLAKRLGVTHIFSTQVHTAGVDLNGIKVLPLVFVPWNGVDPAESKDILYSFVGFETCKMRTKIFRLSRKNDVLIIKRRAYYGDVLDAKRKSREAAEYKDVIARSRFGLCPRGSYPNSVRLTELMQAGAIPVVIADDLVLPDGINWDDYLIKIREKDFDRVDAIIRSIPLDQEQKIRANCLKLSAALKKDPAYFIRYYFQNNSD